jgi:hypothetical protein
MRKLLIAVAVATAALLTVHHANAQSSSQDVKRCIEGVYVLEEFKKDGEVFRPPQVAGRYVILNGVVLFIFHDRTQQSKQISNIGFGTYTVSSAAYTLHYDDYAMYTHTSAETSVSRQPPWEGLRSFTTVLEQDGMHLRNPDEPRDEFLCSADGLVYTFGPGNYRKYRRTKSG